MAEKKKKLTNIKPREVGLVDQGAILEDFYVTKKQEGENMGKKVDQPVLKKMAVAIHTINFFKSQYANKEECIAKMAEDGIEGAENFPVKESDYEYQFEINAASLFEGTSLGQYNYVGLNQGVDSLIGVLKGLSNFEDIAKKGAKISSKRMSTLKTISESITKLIKELDDEPEIGEPVIKADTQATTEESEMEVKKNEEKSVEEKSTEVKKNEEKSVEETKTVEESVEKRLEAIEKKQAEEIEKKQVEEIKKTQTEEIKTLKDENVELKKKLSDVEKTPGETNNNEADNTEEVQKNHGGFWNGVL